jgi:hypothetical protein
MRLNVAVPEAHVSAPVLDAALEATTRLNESLLKSGELDPYDMQAPGVRWRPEPPGEEHFDHGLMVQGRGWGDCDDLAPWHAASLRVTGKDRGAKACVRKSGPTRWHAVVRRSDGRIDDPSLAAGMPGRGAAHGVRGAWQPPMFARTSVVGGTYIARPQLAMRPIVDRLSNEIEAWQARTDLPWHAGPGSSPTDIAMASLHASPLSDQALVGALEGAIRLGRCNGANPEHLDRLRAVSDMVQGATWEDVAEVYGDEHADAASHVVGSFFKRFFRPKNLLKFALNPMRVLPGGKMLDPGRLLKSKMFRGVVSKGLQFIPGVGPIASSAFDAASPMLQSALSRLDHQRPPEYGGPEEGGGFGFGAPGIPGFGGFPGFGGGAAAAPPWPGMQLPFGFGG